MSFWTEPRSVSTWKCFLEVHCQYDAMLTHAPLCFRARLTARLFVLLWDWTWKTRRPRGQRWQRKTNPLAGPSEFSPNSCRRDFDLWLWFSPGIFQTHTSLLWYLFCILHHVYFFISIYVQLHPVVGVCVPLRTFLCMNDCTLPIHLNSTLHITSTLIWAIKCVVLFVCLFFIFTAFYMRLLSFEFHWCCYNDKMDPVVEMTFPEDDQPSTMTARDGNVLLLIFAHSLSSIKLL